MKETRLSTRRARRRRREPTEAEACLWAALRNRRLADIKFRRQAPVGPFIAAFLSHEAMVAIVIEDDPHAQDSRCAAFLRHKGYRVLQFRSIDILRDPGAVIALISAALPITEKRRDTSPTERTPPWQNA